MLKIGTGSVRVSGKSDNGDLISISQLLLADFNISFSLIIPTFCSAYNRGMQVSLCHVHHLSYTRPS
jgi:hypothetical protein